MKSFFIGFLLSSMLVLSGCQHASYSGSSSSVPGFPPGHDLASHSRVVTA